MGTGCLWILRRAGHQGRERGFHLFISLLLGEGGVSCIRKVRIKEFNPRLILFSLFTRLKTKKHGKTGSPQTGDVRLSTYCVWEQSISDVELPFSF